MGYRSDVVYVFYTKRDHAKTFPLLKLWFAENYPKQDFYEMDTDDETYIRVTYEGVKWYDGYPEVVAVEEATERFNETFEANSEASAKDQDAQLDISAFAWEGVRIGEDDNDITHDGSLWHDYRLGVNRSIYFN